MVSKGTFVLTLMALAITRIEGTCEVTEALLKNAWMYEYEGATYERLNFRLTNTTFMKYRNNDKLETFECVQLYAAAPVQVMLALAEDGTTKRCFQFIGFNTGVAEVMYGFREVAAGTADTANLCLAMFEGNGVAAKADILLAIRFDPDNEQTNGGFDFALSNGECASTFPVAYEATTDPTNEDILLTKELSASVNIGDGNGIQCEGQSGSKCTRQPDSNVVACKLCNVNKPTGYNYPLDGDEGRWRCLGNMLSTTVGISGPHFQTFAIQDKTDRWHFVCVRHEELPGGNPGDPKCMQFSMDLTNEKMGACRLEYQGNPVTTDQVTRDGDVGFISFKLCAEDCKNNLCENEKTDQCVQERNKFNCGECDTNYEGFLCQKEKKECGSNPCLNGGLCTELVATEGFECNCKTGFKGTRCEISTCRISDTWTGVEYFYKYQGATVDKTQTDKVVFEDSRFVTIAGEKWDCEREADASGIITFTMVKLNADGSPTSDQRTCVEVIPLNPLTNTKRSYHLIRISPKTSGAIIDPATCGFLSTDKYNVLIHPNVVYGDSLPVEVGTYQVMGEFGASTCGTGDTDSTAELVVGSNTINLGSSCSPEANTLFPVGKLVSVMYSFDATVMADPNAKDNGGVMLVAIENLLTGDNGPTFYCARFKQDTPETPTIDISFNIKNQLAPECLPNADAEKSNDNHLHLKLTSNRCHVLGNPCSPGKCGDTPNQDFTCTECPPGFRNTGKTCEQIDECAPKPCNDLGTVKCADGDNTFTCECKNGWTGDLCEIEDVCYNHGCLNGATCNPDSTDDRKYSCACVRGWVNGPLRICETDYDECQSNPCQNDGTCYQDKKGADGLRRTELDYFECECKPGFSGTLCERETDNCTPNPCLNGGTCVNYADKVANPPGWYCKCRPGFIWQRCEHENECLTKNPPICHPENTLSCEDRLEEVVCNCKEGFLGGNIKEHFKADCSQPDTSNPCSTQPCKNGGICTKKDEDGFQCDCTPQFGGLTCIEAQLSCADNPCDLRETCTPTTSRNATAPYTCTCPDGVVCGKDDEFGVIEQALVGLLCALVLGCIILGIWAICSNKCGPCGKGGCCP